MRRPRGAGAHRARCPLGGPSVVVAPLDDVIVAQLAPALAAVVVIIFVRVEPLVPGGGLVRPQRALRHGNGRGARAEDRGEGALAERAER